MFHFRMRGLAIRNLATYPPPVQTYSVKAFGPFFTWVYHAEDAAVTSLDNFEKMDTPVTSEAAEVFAGSVRAISPTTGRCRHVETKDEHQGNPGLGPLLTRSSSGSIGIGEPLRTASSIPLEVCFPDKQVGKHANTKHSR